MIKTTDMLLDELRKYKNPRTKLSRMVKSGNVFPIVKGLYETNPSIPAIYLAASIYGPSYISFETALEYYHLIPEAVYTITSATFEKKKKKKYETLFGTFTFQDVPAEAFPLGINVVKEEGYYYRIATPEKALCDLLYTYSPVANTKELVKLLTESLRIEEEDLIKLDIALIETFSKHYHTTNIKKLYTLLRRLRK